MSEIINIATFALDTSKLQSSLDSLNDTYFDLRKEQQAYKDQSKQVAKELDVLVKSQKALTDAAGDNSDAIEENDKQIQELLKTQKDLYKSEQNLAVQMGTVKKEINQTTTQLRAYQDAEGKTTSLIDLGNEALSRSVKNKNEARAANIALNNVANQLNPNIEEEAKLLKELNAKIDENTEFIKENSSETAKQKMNIGNYADAVKGISPQLDAMIDQLQGIYASLLLKKQALMGVTTATTGTSKAMQVLKAALISTGIGAIVVVLGTLIAYLTTTQKGIDALTSVTRPLQAVFQSLLGVAQDLGEKLFNTFSNPKKALADLGEFVKNNLINRFKAFGVILDGIINLDFKKVSNGVLQAGTGVENVTGKIANAGKQTAKFLTDAAKKGQEIDRLQKDIERSTLKYNKAQVAVNDALDEQRLISKDTSKSFAEREAAARKIIAITKANGAEEAKIVEKQIAKLKLQQSLNDTSREGKQELIDLEEKLDAANDRGLEAEFEQLKVIAGARKEAAEQAKANQEKANEQLLKNSRDEINLFIANQGFKRKSAEDEFKFNNELLAREEKDLKLQLDKKKISQKEYEANLQNLRNDTASKNADLLIENATLEVDAALEANAKILANDKYLSDEQLKLKQQSLQNQFLAEQNYQKLLLENGKINQAEYNAEINRINEENRLANEELTNQRIASEQEKKIIDLENQKIIDEENFIAQAELEKQKNAILLAQELEAAEKNGADKALIEAKYAKQNEDIDRVVYDNKLKLASQTFGQLASILGENSKAGKAAAIAQATIDTYQGINSVWATPSTLPEPFATAQKIVSTAVVAKSGFDSVKKITATKQPSVKKASYASGVIGLRGAGDGMSDNITANLSAGESVINARSTAMFARELAAINQAGGGVGLNGSSNIINQNEIQTNANNSQMASMIAEAVAIGSELGTSKGTQSGMVKLSDNRKVMSDAKF